MLKLTLLLAIARVATAAMPGHIGDDVASTVAWDALRLGHTFGRPMRAVTTFKKGASPREATNRIMSYGEAQVIGVAVKELSHVGAAVLEYPPNCSFDAVRDHFARILEDSDSLVEHIEADSLVGVPSMEEFEGLVSDGEIRNPMGPFQAADEFIPDDSLFGLLWGMTNIRGPAAWKKWTGAEPTAARPIVTVIDTGVDYTHPDLAGNIWVNEAELNGEPGVDDDGNGYVDDVYGWNAVENNGDPMDDHWHGTHCAGTIGAIGNNTLGVAGVSWGPLIQGCKFLNKSGQGATSDALACIDYSIATGAHISSNSWGSFAYSPALKNAIELAAAAGQIFIAAAGNSGQNTDKIPFYPAGYDVDNVVSVGALTIEDKLATFSNYGPKTVDIAAPGATIASTFPGGFYSYGSGTSMAAPHLSGAAALAWSMNPKFDYHMLISLLKNSVTPIPGGTKLGWGGKLDVARMVTSRDMKSGGSIAGVVGLVGPSTASCRELCAMSSLSCNEEMTYTIHTDLVACLAAVEAMPVRAYWAAGSVGEMPSYFPAGCYAVHHSNTFVVSINTLGQPGCGAENAGVAESDRVCMCSM